MVQEVFAEAQHHPNGAGIACWPAMLRRMTTCRALDALRRRRVTMSLETAQPLAGKNDPQAIAAGRELESRLRVALAELAPREAEVFCYLGKGVKLGDKDRIVCWYKLKDAKDPKTYRVVYGDLKVKDVASEALPLPVNP